MIYSDIAIKWSPRICLMNMKKTWHILYEVDLSSMKLLDTENVLLKWLLRHFTAFTCFVRLFIRSVARHRVWLIILSDFASAPHCFRITDLKWCTNNLTIVLHSTFWTKNKNSSFLLLFYCWILVKAELRIFCHPCDLNCFRFALTASQFSMALKLLLTMTMKQKTGR